MFEVGVGQTCTRGRRWKVFVGKCGWIVCRPQMLQAHDLILLYTELVSRPSAESTTDSGWSPLTPPSTSSPQVCVWCFLVGHLRRLSCFYVHLHSGLCGLSVHLHSGLCGLSVHLHSGLCGLSVHLHSGLCGLSVHLHSGLCGLSAACYSSADKLPTPCNLSVKSGTFSVWNGLMVTQIKSLSTVTYPWSWWVQ